MILLMFVLDNPDKIDDLLDAWMAAGVRGITILDSSGVHSRRGNAERQSVPMFLGLSRMFQSDQYVHNTLFSVVQDESIIPAVVKATEGVVGDLSKSHTGVLFTLPVLDVWGIHKPHHEEEGGTTGPDGEGAE